MKGKYLIVIYAVLSITSCNTKKQGSFFLCNPCSELKGLQVVPLNDSLYLFDLDYPVGFSIGKDFQPYYEIDWVLKPGVDTLYFLNSSYDPLLSFNKQSVFVNNIRGVKVKSSMDATINVKDRIIYVFRLENMALYHSYYPFGTGLLLFITKENGVEGMCLSRYGYEEIVNTDEYSEIIYYPVGNIFGKDKADTVKLGETFNPPDKYL